MAGGTGGHVFPAIAIAKKLEEQGNIILWLGTRGRMEEKLVPQAGFDIEYINVRGIRRNGLRAKLTAPFMVMRAVMQALGVISDFHPDVALGMGGYASGPGGIAARMTGVPLVLHEQNAAAGLTNRLLSKIATRIMLGFPGAFKGPKVSVVGNPVRAEILSLFGRRREFPAGPLRVLVVGGSLGAQALNSLVPEAMKAFAPGEISVTHQCGGGHGESVRQAYEGVGCAHEVCEFISDMAKAYTGHDLIICRAGASTVGEVACAGMPAIFVPLPTAVDDHQTKNASFLAKAGAALLCHQSELTADSLAETLRGFVADRQRLSQMSEQAFACAAVDATEKAAEIVAETAEI